MSDNNQNKGAKGRGKDSFVKPGDESIVSGKSFFLSFGKQKKSSANPLIESEKNKNNQKNGEHPGAQDKKDNGAKSKERKNDGAGNPRDNEGKSAGDRKNKPHYSDRKKNQNRDRDRNADGTAEKKQSTQTSEKVQTEVREERREKNNANQQRNDRRSFKKDNRDTKDSVKDTGKEAVKENTADNNRENIKGDPEERNRERQQNSRHKNHQNQHNQRRDDRKNRDGRDAQEQKQEKQHSAVEENIDRNAKKNGGRFANDDRRRPKHKKEKFIPTAPEGETPKEELLQPIVDRTGIVSGPTRGFGMRGTKSSYLSGDTAAQGGDEPRYIDRNRPLAEQIAEQSKPKIYKNHLTENTETVEVIGVRFREAGKVYYFAPEKNKVEKGQAVIVETARGVEYGFCAIANRNVSTDNIVPPLKPILRVATSDDTDRYESNKQLEEGAAKVFREKVRALGLEMSLVYVEYTFDNGKLLFYFTADGRVDFRELIKELASAFRTRIELRQIGVRDEAKIVGGLGICGRPVCCKSFLGEFSQVSIKMAKDQNLFINSSKISGTCGRFMCCIRYEDEVYQKEYERTPKVDALVETPEGKGVVVESNALKGVVKVLLDDKPEEIAKPFKCTEVKLLGYIKRENENEVPEGMDIPEEGSGS